jgi:hypothetical protein
VTLFRKHWSEVKGQAPVKETYLAEAEADGTELLGLLDVADTAALGSPRDLRQRAYTHWLAAYMEILHLGRYLQRHDIPQRAGSRPCPHLRGGSVLVSKGGSILVNGEGVYLELADATPAEAERGMAMLRKLVG